MNDFTKEELQGLYDCCNSGIYDDYPQADWKAALQDKLQSLIDNYCEHEFKMNMHDAEWHCYKCGVLQ